MGEKTWRVGASELTKIKTVQHHNTKQINESITKQTKNKDNRRATLHIKQNRTQK